MLNFSFNVLADKLHSGQLASCFGELRDRDFLILSGNGMSIAVTESSITCGWYAPRIEPSEWGKIQRKEIRIL